MSPPDDKAADSEPTGPPAAEHGAFAPTHWSQVIMTGHEDPALAGAALEKLYKVYRGPIYMEPALLREDAKDLYAPWAAALAMSQEAVEVAFHRLRRRFGKALRHEVEQTVPDPADAKEELICLLAATVD